MISNFKKNIIYLTSVQALNYLIPFVTFPFLVRVLGPENFGLLAITVAFNSYFTILIDYGFNLSATQEISKNRNDNNKLVEIYSSVMTIKAALLGFCFFVLLLLISFFSEFERYAKLYLLGFGTVIGLSISPLWFLQGLEQLKEIIKITVITRFLVMIFTFLLIKDENDYYVVAMLNSFGTIIIGVYGLIIVRDLYKIKFKVQSRKILLHHLQNGWYVFTSTLLISLYTNSMVFILGFFSGSSAAGHFSAADKIIQAVKGLFAPFSQAIYPYASQKLENNKIDGIAFILNIKDKIGIVLLFACAGLYWSSDLLVDVILGVNFENSKLLLRIMSPLPLIIFLSNIYGIQILLNLGYKKHFTKIIFVAAGIGLFMSFLFVPYYNSIATAYISLLVELFVTIAFIYLFKIQFKKML